MRARQPPPPRNRQPEPLPLPPPPQRRETSRKGAKERVRERGVLRLQPGLPAARDRARAGRPDRAGGGEARGGLRPCPDRVRVEAGAAGACAGRDHRLQGAVSGERRECALKQRAKGRKGKGALFGPTKAPLYKQGVRFTISDFCVYTSTCYSARSAFFVLLFSLDLSLFFGGLLTLVFGMQLPAPRFANTLAPIHDGTLASAVRSSPMFARAVCSVPPNGYTQPRLADAARGARDLGADTAREAGQGPRPEGAPPMAHAVSGGAAWRAATGRVRGSQLAEVYQADPLMRVVLSRIDVLIVPVFSRFVARFRFPRIDGM